MWNAPDDVSFVLRIECNNAAFADDPRIEIASILRRTAHLIETGLCRSQEPISDRNGNPVGRFKLTRVRHHPAKGRK